MSGSSITPGSGTPMPGSSASASSTAAQPAAGSTNHDLLKLRVEVWKQIVDVQKHFNELEMKIRNYALTLVLAVLGAAAVAVQEGVRLEVFGFGFSLASALLAAGTLAWLAFYFMDRHWYHRLLHGAVAQGISLETALAPDIPGIGLTTTIKAASPSSIGAVDDPGATAPGLDAAKERGWHSDQKLDAFYFLIAGILVLLALASIGAGTNGASHAPEPLVVRIDQLPPEIAVRVNP
jgi:hypothetical protein